MSKRAVASATACFCIWGEEGVFGKTIAAISTPYGRGGVALIRVSGDEAVEICEKVFLPKGSKRLGEVGARMAVYGDIVSGGRVIDDGVAYVYRAPASYTGEDTVEICCHGGIHLTNKVLEAIIVSGAEYAEPGEFTQRAFVNGKLTLTEAEAVINLIDAQSDDQIRLATSHRRGVLSKAADALYKRILSLISSTYAYIDYPDEDLTDISAEQLKGELERIKDELLVLERSYNTGRAVSEGISCAIVGKPNSGKSSLLNALVGHERAIVTDVAGTTRDVIEESVRLEHIILRISDTAGIRETQDTVEKIGVERSYAMIDKSELIAAVFDGSLPLDDEDLEIIAYLKRECADKRIIAVINKSDLTVNEDTMARIEREFEHAVVMSAKERCGTEGLFELAESFFAFGDIDYDTNAVIANSRQYTAVRQARESIQRALVSLENGFTQDIAGMDLEQALVSIGELDSREVSEDIVKDIFGRFCVGK